MVNVYGKYTIPMDPMRLHLAKNTDERSPSTLEVGTPPFQVYAGSFWMMIHPYHKKCPNSLPPSYLEMVGQWWTSSRVDVLKLSRSGCESPITRIFLNSPKNPSPPPMETPDPPFMTPPPGSKKQVAT